MSNLRFEELISSQYGLTMKVDVSASRTEQTDGMLHAMVFKYRQAEYRNRLIRAEGFEAE